MHSHSPACAKHANFRVDSFVCAIGAEWRSWNARERDRGGFPGSSPTKHLARPLHMPDSKTHNKGEATMLKNILIALGIAALTSTSAFAATKAPKTAPAAHKVAQATEIKPTAAKADKKVKKDKKVTEAAVKAPASAEKTPAPAKK
jgi:hypothetical protein